MLSPCARSLPPWCSSSPPPLPALAQSNWFQPSLLERPDVKKALQSVDERSSAIVDEWIRLVEIPAPSRKEQARAQYIRAEMQKLGLTDIRMDDMSNVSGVRKGTGGGPTVVFARTWTRCSPRAPTLKVKREGDILRAPGIGDDTSNLMATLEMFRALNRGGVQTKGDLMFLASVQEELGLLGAKHWLETSGYKPDMFVAVDVVANQVWYGALRIKQFKFFYTSPGAHTMESRGAPSPAKAVAKAIDGALRDPAAAGGRGPRHVQAARGERRDDRRRDGGERHAARGVVHGGSALARHADASELEAAVEAAARRAGEQEGVGFRMEKIGAASTTRRRGRRRSGSITRWCRRRSPTAITSASRARRPSFPPTSGPPTPTSPSRWAFPPWPIGAALEHMPHRLEENAEASSIVPGIKSLIALAVTLTSHQ